jgi:hypothetical protein
MNQKKKEHFNFEQFFRYVVAYLNGTNLNKELAHSI